MEGESSTAVKGQMLHSYQQCVSLFPRTPFHLTQASLMDLEESHGKWSSGFQPLVKSTKII
jgi:hypothetical protein